MKPLFIGIASLSGLAIATHSKQYATATLNSSTLALDSHPIEAAIAQLGRQYGAGMVTAKVVSLQ